MLYYTPEEVAERLKLSVTTIYKYIHRGQLPAVKLPGNRLRVSDEALTRFLDAYQYAGRPPAPEDTEDEETPRQDE